MEKSKAAKWTLQRLTRFAVVVCLMGLPASVMLITIYFEYTAVPVFHSPAKGSSTISFRRSDNTVPVKLLPGMLIDTTKFDTKTCTSRYNSHQYRKSSTRDPSAYLVSKLRKYENLHRQCGPNTKHYKAAMKELRTLSRPNNYRNQANSSMPCRYVVWTPANGLGNRMLSLVSAFLYGILTDRVLLVDFNKDAMTRLFCEPFPNSTWLLQEDFGKIVHGEKYEERNEKIMTFNNLVENNKTIDESSGPLVVYVNLRYGRGEDSLPIFHCDHSQELLQGVPALIIKSDEYFVPSLFMMSSFQQELSKLFPEKDAVFNLLGNYLFQPSNEAWERITTFYEAYLAQADQRVGLQIRVFHPLKTQSQTIIDEVLSCTRANNLLPEIRSNMSTTGKGRGLLSTGILTVSLHSIYGDTLKEMYRNSSNDSGQVTGVYQPSNEGYQKHNNQEHDIKAWVEIYLLSLCDVLVTSYGSTFGYVAQSLGGLKPWILENVEVKNVPNPPCRQVLSMEPCFHYPLELGCGRNTSSTNITTLFPFIRHCEDFKWGVKLVSNM